ncbi:hypothetical protein D3C81_1538370 [compost metagenome]
MIMRASEDHLPWGEFRQVLEELVAAVKGDDFQRVRQILRATVDGYKPEGEIVDWIHQQRQFGTDGPAPS